MASTQTDVRWISLKMDKKSRQEDQESRPVILIRTNGTSMVDIPTSLVSNVVLGKRESVSFEGKYVNYCQEKVKQNYYRKPDLQFKRAVLGVGLFLIFLSFVLVGTVMWFSYKFTNKEIEREFSLLFNMTSIKDIE